MRRSRALSASSAAIATLAGCASVDPRPSFQSVQAAVEERSGQRIRWIQGGPEDREVHARIMALLGKPLTAEAAVEVALINNPRLQALYEEIGIAQADLVQAGLLKNPTLGAGIGFPLRGANSSADFSIAQDFLDLFTLPLRKRVAGAQLEAAQLRIGAAVLEMAVEARSAFLATQAAQQLAEVQRTLLSASQAAADLSRGQHEAGNVNDLTYLLESATYQQQRLDLARAEAQVLADRERLTRALGVFGEQTNWKIEANLEPVPAQEISLDHLESLAIRRRLDLAAARGELDALSQTLSLATGLRYFGSVELGASLNFDSEGNRTLGPQVRLELPIFDQGQAKLARLEGQRRQAIQRLAGLAIGIRSEVRAARNRLNAARQIEEHYRTVLLPLRERIVQLAQQHYNSSLLGVYQLLQMKQAEVSSYRDYIDAVRDYWVARAELERAAGGMILKGEKR